MLESILGSVRREQVLLYLYCRGEGYAREIARFFGSSLDPVQKQLDRLESGGVLFSRLVGRTRQYGLDPRYPFTEEVGTLLDKALSFYPEQERQRLTLDRRRPRRKGKPL